MTSLISPSFTGNPGSSHDDRPHATKTLPRLRSPRTDHHAGSITPIAVRPIPTRVSAADRAARKVLVTLLGHLSGGRLTVIEPDGSTLVFGEPVGPEALDVTVTLRTAAVWREVATKASRGLGESWWLWRADAPRRRAHGGHLQAE